MHCGISIVRLKTSLYCGGFRDTLLQNWAVIPLRVDASLAGEKRSSVLHTECVRPEIHPIYQHKHQHLSHYIRVYVTVHGDKSLDFRQKRSHLRRDMLMPLA